MIWPLKHNTDLFTRTVRIFQGLNRLSRPLNIGCVSVCHLKNICAFFNIRRFYHFTLIKNRKHKLINHSNIPTRHNGKSSSTIYRSLFNTVYSSISNHILLNRAFSNNLIGIIITSSIYLHISTIRISSAFNDAKYWLVWSIRYRRSSSGCCANIDLSHVLIINSIIIALESVISFTYYHSVFLSSLESLSMTYCILDITISNYSTVGLNYW